MKDSKLANSEYADGFKAPPKPFMPGFTVKDGLDGGVLHRGALLLDLACVCIGTCAGAQQFQDAVRTMQV